MAIEKMTMVNMVGHIDDMDRVCKSVVLSESLHPVNALQEIDTTDFTITTTENNLEALIDVCYIRPYAEERDYTDIQKKINEIRKMCTVNQKYNLSQDELYMNYSSIEYNLNKLYDKFNDIYSNLSNKINYKNDIEAYIKNLYYIKDIDIPVEDISNLKNFYCELYKVPAENIVKLKDNYENIPSIVMKVYSSIDYETVIAFTPKVLKKESDRIFKSLNCEQINVPDKYKGTPKDVIEGLKCRLNDINKEIDELTQKLNKLSEEENRNVYIIDKSLELELQAFEVKNNAACTNEFFYLCGWVPESLLKGFKDRMAEFESRLVIVEKKSHEIKNSSIIPPTKLRNNPIVRPFESMVSMYGIPSYNELDPTAFLGISYMIMFGAMFGDLGQGLVFLLMGLILKYKKKRPNLGGVIARVGISSSIFGVLYGSFFGFENVIPALFIRPMKNISEILLYAIVFGCGLLIIGFVYSLINNAKKKDIENGLFGKNGAAGLAFYISALILVYTKLKNIPTMSGAAWAAILIILLVVILLKQPIANIVRNRKPLFNEGKSDYFIEEGFGIAETILSLFSNTLSFIRVGAFALNHVGLFIAFAALAHMMKSGAMSITMYVLGNIIILGLEGLIVFIQGLRLEYYELFSKYYDGEGIEFSPVKISGNIKLSSENKVFNNADKKLILENKGM